MACCVGPNANVFSQPMLAYCQLDLYEHISMNVGSKYYDTAMTCLVWKGGLWVAQALSFKG